MGIKNKLLYYDSVSSRGLSTGSSKNINMFASCFLDTVDKPRDDNTTNFGGIMLLTNTENSYGLIAKLFHWLMSIIVIVMLIVGFSMDNFIEPPLKWQLYGIHEATGIVVLSLVIIRLLWKFYNANVLLPEDMPNWQKKAANININLLYLLMLLMPISGFFMTILSNHHIDFYGLFTINSFAQDLQFAKIFKKIHKKVALLFTALIILHILAALYHHFIRKDNVLKRMWNE
nr:cytochrome b/b6 domain-containing protein [Rickettsia asembonensis]